MRILTRYVLSEFLKVFLVSLAGMTLMLLLVGIIREALNQGLGVTQSLMLIPYVLPDVLRFTVPAAMLFAGCSVYGRLASANEVIAVKASGISPMALLWPTFTLAFLISLAAVWLNDIAVIWGADGVRQVVINSIEDVAYGRLRLQHSYSSRQFSINVKDVDGKRLMRPEITFQGEGDEPSTNISCAEASLHTDLEEQTFTITCRNGVLERGGVSFSFPDTWQQSIAVGPIGRPANSPTDLAMSSIPADEVLQRTRIETLQQQMTATAACQMLTGDFASLAGPAWDRQQSQVKEARQRIYRLEMEPPRRWANGFSCLCFLLVGAPLAICFRNADFLASFFACFLPILIVYYPLLMFALSQCKNGSLPSYSVWAGNLILAAIGLFFMHRVYYR